MNAIVVSAHYRLAPEHKFTAAHDYANAAWRWLLANAASLGGDPTHLAVMGESAGANLAANVSIYTRAPARPCADVAVGPHEIFTRNRPTAPAARTQRHRAGRDALNSTQ